MAEASAAGRTAASVPARGYSSGLSLSDALFFGRLAGAAAAVAPTQEAGPEDQ
jgi:succinate dehydrogenase/fumarate reductase flavoprotein subunit